MRSTYRSTVGSVCTERWNVSLCGRRIAYRRGRCTGEDSTGKGGMYPLLLLLPFFSLNRPSMVDFSFD
ncbi:hypothetical protein BHE74_00020844 [Ensete ventricosum]|nr:hypothetical protein GW17_00043093 [Ensete ventricosum]RWW71414.1 hypothetical protein BHE74_00020844 [Ensete ventricosum]RZR99721.1 hypothetical protein BHM03_00029322 [Ensete ventricosum]